MLQFGREKLSSGPPSPVEELLQKVERLDRGYCYRDDYLHRLQAYLDSAKEYGLHSEPVVDSCIDLAKTFTNASEVVSMRQLKLDAWTEARATALRVARDPVEIAMELDPVYFEAILRGTKTYEGRAYKPDSDKNYPGIRRYDRIRFRLSQRKEEFAAELVARGLQFGADMMCTVGEVYFAPTVHGMYQLLQFSGLGFQPMVNGPSEIMQLQRAAVYHTFPGYHELISEHGFLGIQIGNPQLVMAS